MARRLVSALAAAGLAVLSSWAGSASASSPTVLGAGSTWDQIATNQWEADVHTLYGITVNYQGVGSTAGRQFYIENQVDFGDSDIPFLPEELRQLRSEHKSFQYLPTVAGGTGIMYNLRSRSGKRINNLRLDSKALAGIFTGVITQWSSPTITRQNPQLRGQIPNARIIPVVRSDGSGTSAMFSDYLRHLEPGLWHTFCQRYGISPCGQTSFWPLAPGFVGQKGSDGVANYVQQQTSTLTYVETGYALERNFPVALVKNKSGHYVFPSSVNDATALRHARIRSDLVSDLSGVHTAPEKNAYPISGYSYMITPTKVGFNFTREKGAVLGRFILYSACAGQKKAAPLGYSPLTPVLVRGVFAAVRRIPGAPKPPPLSECDNPTLTGAGVGGGATGNPGGAGSTGGSGASGTAGGGGGGGAGQAGGTGESQNNGGGNANGAASTTGGGAGADAGNVDATTKSADGAAHGIQPIQGLQLSAAQLAANRALAEKAVAPVKPASGLPLLLAALDLLVLVLCPWMIWRRRKPREILADGTPGSSESLV